MDLSVLKDLPIFKHLTSGQCHMLEATTTRQEYAPGAAILTQGATGGGFHVIVSGSVRVLVGADPRVQVARLGPGEYFGEIAAVTGDVHGATVEAADPTVTVEFTREGLLCLLECSPALTRHILETMARRMKQTNRRVHEVHVHERALAGYLSAREGERLGELVGVSPAGARLRAAVTRLAQSREPVLLVGEAGAGKAHVAAHIHLQGRRQRPLVELSAAEWTAEAWQQRLRLAGGGTLLLQNLQALPEAGTRTVLEWLRSAGDGAVRFLGTCTLTEDPAGTGMLPPLDPKTLAACGCTVLRVPHLRERREDIPALVLHFLRQEKKRPVGNDLAGVITPEAMRLLHAFPYLQGNVRELAAVVRAAVALAGDGPVGVEHLRLGGYHRRQGRPAVGLALGGGIVRGAAHVGVIRVLTDSGIPIDCIAGTSVGALVGGLYAGGMSAAEMERLALGMGWWDLVRPILPRTALVHNRPTVRFVEREVGPITFRDLRIPFAAVAADFRTAEPVILREGRLSEAIQASTAIPGLVTPVRRGERLLVDGFVVSTVPVHVARSLGADLVVAVDPGMPADIRWQPGSLGFSVLRAMEILSRRQVERELDWADLTIHATDPTVSAYSFRSLPRFLRAGEVAATEMLPQIRRRLADLAEEFA